MADSGHEQMEHFDGAIVEQVLRNGKRRFAPAFKSWVVEQCLRPDISVAAIALANGLNANLLRKWVKDRNAERAMEPLLPVRIVWREQLSRDAAAQSHAAARESGHIEVEIDGALLRVHGEVSAQ